MRLNYELIRADFLQRARSYRFLIVVISCSYIAYIFVPDIDASYTTISMGKFKGIHNSAWIGTISAVMSSFFLAWTGFFLVSNGIQKDIKTGLGQIIATTSISNSEYLKSKAMSNFLVLLTAVSVVFLTTMAIFIFRETHAFVFMVFLKPFLYISIPSMFIIAHMAVIAEIIFKNKTILQGILSYYLFAALIPITMFQHELMHYLNPLGVNFVMDAIRLDIFNQFGIVIEQLSMGFVFSSKDYDFFTFSGVTWTIPFVLGRLFFMMFSVFALSIFSNFFHRFDIKKKVKAKSNKVDDMIHEAKRPTEIKTLSKIKYNFGIKPLIQFEFIILFKRSNRLFTFLNLALWISTIFIPIEIAINFLLPLLLFLQIDKWSTLSIRDEINRTDFFTMSAFSPIKRITLSRILAAILFSILIAFPVILRQLIQFDINSAFAIISGLMLLVSFSFMISLLSQSQKLFEILFTVITFGIFQAPEKLNYLNDSSGIILLLSVICYILIYFRNIIVNLNR